MYIRIHIYIEFSIIITSRFLFTIYLYFVLGPMIRAITDNMIIAQNMNSPDTKIYLYSGHETNIASLLQAFGVYEPHVPKYSSAIIMELQEINQEYYVKVSVCY